MRVLVRGTGVAGLTVARELCVRGIPVEIVDRASSVGSGASGLAGGMLAPFCEGESAPDVVTRLGIDAADWWQEAVPGEVHREGTLVVAAARETPELARFASRTESHRWVDENEIAAIEPALAGRFRKGLFFATEAHLTPARALAALHKRLTSDGVAFRFDHAADPRVEEADIVVDCTGAASIGRTPGLRGVRGEMIEVETDELALSRPVRLLHPRHPIYIVPRPGNRFMIGATMIEANDDGPVSVRSLMDLLNAAYALHPAFGEARVVRMGAGVRPAFDDNLPRVHRDGRTIHVNGFYRHGFLLAPAMAKVVADLIERNAP